MHLLTHLIPVVRTDAAFVDPPSHAEAPITHTCDNPYKCSICGTAFTTIRKPTVHMRTHTGEKPYKCSTCNAAFTASGSLKNHTRIHTGEEHYKCTCRSGDLKSRTKVHSGERLCKSYKCTEATCTCGKTFAHVSTLKKYIRGSILVKNLTSAVSVVLLFLGLKPGNNIWWSTWV